MSEHIDEVFVKNLRVRTIIGTSDEERKDRQEVVICYALLLSTKSAGMSDNIDDTVNYRTVSKLILTHVETHSFHLVEKVAEDIALICLRDARVEEAMVTVEKPRCIRFADTAGVTIRRRKSTSPPEATRSP